MGRSANSRKRDAKPGGGYPTASGLGNEVHDGRDANTKTTTFNDPRGPKIGKGQYGVPAAYERSFRWKLTQFRYLCHYNALPSHIKIQVARANIFEDSFHAIMRVPPHELRRRLFITFRGEEGLDYGGIAREWFFLLSHEVSGHRVIVLVVTLM
jgi:hypothetical protein